MAHAEPPVDLLAIVALTNASAESGARPHSGGVLGGVGPGVPQVPRATRSLSGTIRTTPPRSVYRIAVAAANRRAVKLPSASRSDSSVNAGHSPTATCVARCQEVS